MCQIFRGSRIYDYYFYAKLFSSELVSSLIFSACKVVARNNSNCRCKYKLHFEKKRRLVLLPVSSPISLRYCLLDIYFDMKPFPGQFQRDK